MRRTHLTAVLLVVLAALAAVSPSVAAVQLGPHVPGWVLAIQASGNGSGRVTSTQLATPCAWDGTTQIQSGTCTITNLAPLQKVQLDAAATTSGTFVTWTNCTRVEGNSCFIENTNQFKLVKVAFTKGVTISVSKAGTGSGTVTSSPTGINCGTVCSAAFATGQSVTLTAAPAPGSTFVGWGGACASTSGLVCTVVADAAKSVTVTFSVAASAQTLTVTIQGQGRVTSSPAGISCPSTCASSFASGTGVSLSASASSGYRLDHWDGCDTSSGSTCTVTLSASRSVTAVFVDVAISGAVTRVRTGHSGGHRTVRTTVQDSEPLTVTIRIVRAGRTIASKTASLGVGTHTVTVRIPDAAAGGRVTVEITLRDAAGNQRTVRRSVTLPRD